MQQSATRDYAAPSHVTIRTAARIVGVGERVLRAAVARGEVPVYRIPRAWPRVAVAEVTAWLHVHRAPVKDHGEARLRGALESEARGAS